MYFKSCHLSTTDGFKTLRFWCKKLKLIFNPITVDSCFDLVGYRQHGVASNEVISWSTDHPCPLNADDDDLKWNSNPNFCRFANVTKRLTKDNRKNPEYHVIAVMRKLWADKNCFHWGYVHKVHLILYLMNLYSYSRNNAFVMVVNRLIIKLQLFTPIFH